MAESRNQGLDMILLIVPEMYDKDIWKLYATALETSGYVRHEVANASLRV